MVTVAAVLLVPLVLVVVRDHPADVGLRPLGAPTDQPLPAEDGGPAEPATRHTGAARLAVRTLAESTRSRTFWILVGTFWICGWSTNGLIGTHFIPAAHDHGMPQTTAAGLLALIGVFDMVGTVASGWLTDKVDPRWLLFGYYGLRGLSLLFVPALLGPDIHPNLFLFIVFYGLDWVATVPPTIALCRRHFGVARSGVVFGWVFASHMVGAGWRRAMRAGCAAAPATTRPRGSRPAHCACWRPSPASPSGGSRSARRGTRPARSPRSRRWPEGRPCHARQRVSLGRC